MVLKKNAKVIGVDEKDFRLSVGEYGIDIVGISGKLILFDLENDADPVEFGIWYPRIDEGQNKWLQFEIVETTTIQIYVRKNDEVVDTTVSILKQNNDVDFFNEDDKVMSIVYKNNEGFYELSAGKYYIKCYNDYVSNIGVEFMLKTILN